MSPILVTGTDTGVGKTHVTRALLLALRRRGLRPSVIKPIETGCADLSLPEDGVRLSAAAGLPLDLVCPLRFRLPAAPTTAARAEGLTLSRDAVLAAIDVASRLGEPFFIEGAGGALVPITDDLSFADLAALLGARVIVVARHRLGTLNHTRLTLEALRARGATPIAVVFNDTPTADVAPIDHVAELERLVPDLPLFGPLPWDSDDAACVAAVESEGLVDLVLA